MPLLVLKAKIEIFRGDPLPSSSFDIVPADQVDIDEMLTGLLSAVTYRCPNCAKQHYYAQVLGTPDRARSQQLLPAFRLRALAKIFSKRQTALGHCLTHTCLFCGKTFQVVWRSAEVPLRSSVLWLRQEDRQSRSLPGEA